MKKLFIGGHVSFCQKEVGSSFWYNKCRYVFQNHKSFHKRNNTRAIISQIKLILSFMLYRLFYIEQILNSITFILERNT